MDVDGIFCQANSGPHTNGCQFFITCAKTDFLDGKHVVFVGFIYLLDRFNALIPNSTRLQGRLTDGLLTLRKIENVPTGPNNRPKIPVVIAECGEM